MNDTISRQQAIDALGELATFTEDWSCHAWMYTDDVYNAIKYLPPIQPKSGKWKNIVESIEYACGTCDTCGARISMAYKYYEYCPRCGMKNEVEHG